MNLVTDILHNKRACLFLSPHQDDAVLSCGALLTKLSGKTSVTVVNVFTKAHAGPYTLSAKQFLKASQATDAEALYQQREKEDRKVLVQMGIKVINLGLEDALFRRKKKINIFTKHIPELAHRYPTYRFHVEKGYSPNDTVIDLLMQELRKFKSDKELLIFAPYGIGNHADHQIVRKACEAVFATYALYSDFPYNVRLNVYGSKLRGGEIIHLPVDMPGKSKLIKAYQTQFAGLFPKGNIPQHDEIYFTARGFVR